MCVHALVIVHFGSFGKMNNFIRFYPGFSSRIELWLVTATTDSLLRPTRVSAAEYELRLSRVPAAGYKLRLSRVAAAGYKLRQTPSYGWLEFWRLDTSYSWFYPAANSSSGRWIQFTADSVPRLTWVLAARYGLRPVPSPNSLEFR